MLTKAEAIERVARGAAHLDQVRPGWHDRIDVGTLTLWDPCGCIVGQLCGLGQFTTEEANHRFDDHVFELFGTPSGHRFGVNLRCEEMARDLDTPNPTFVLLQDLWIDAIAARRHPVTEPLEAEAVTC